MDGQNVTLDEVRTWPATIDVDTAVRALGISRSHGYRLARDGVFPCRIVRLGGRVRVVTASLLALLECQGEDGKQSWQAKGPRSTTLDGGPSS